MSKRKAAATSVEVHRARSMKIARLNPHPKNYRSHPAEQIEHIRASLREHGFYRNVVCASDLTILAGHGVVIAAEAEGMDSVPVIKLDIDALSTQALKVLAADNFVSRLAEDDTEALEDLLSSIEVDDDLLGTGFEAIAEVVDRFNVTGMAGDAPPTKKVVDSAPPAPPDDPTTKPGDLWLLGPHRLLCGDSTDPEHVARVMNGERAQLCVTDPPYNINYGNIKHASGGREIANDDMDAADFKMFCEAFALQIHTHVSGCVYVFGPPGPDGRIMFSVLDELMHCSTTIIWNKDLFTLGRGKYQNKYEPCWFGWVENGSRFTRSRKLTNVWDFPRPKSSAEHPTMKPVELIANAIGHASRKADLVFEPFMGSGTTLMAAHQLDRRCFGLELSPAYCDVVVGRWEELTGKKAKLGKSS